MHAKYSAPPSCLLKEEGLVCRESQRCAPQKNEHPDLENKDQTHARVMDSQSHLPGLFNCPQPLHFLSTPWHFHGQEPWDVALLLVNLLENTGWPPLRPPPAAWRAPPSCSPQTAGGWANAGGQTRKWAGAAYELRALREGHAWREGGGRVGHQPTRLHTIPRHRRINWSPALLRHLRRTGQATGLWQ